MAATTHLNNLLAHLRFFSIIVLVVGLFGISTSYSQESYPLPYNYSEENFKAYVNISFYAVKGNKKDISSPTETFVDFTDLTQFNKSGQAKLDVLFSNLEFYQGSHARALTLIIRVSHTKELRKYSAKSKFSLNDTRGGNSNKGTEKISYVIDRSSSPSVSFHWTITDPNGRECGKGVISKKMDLIVSGKNNPSLQAQSQSKSISQAEKPNSTRSIDGNSLAQAAQDEEAFWKQITAQDEEDGYQLYITKSDYNVFSGKYREKASDRILEIRDEKAWAYAKATNTKTSYRNYLEDYGIDGKFVSEARKRLNSLNGNVKSNTNTSIKPTEVKTEDKEDAIWNSVKEDGTPASLKRYLSLYPDGKYMEEALMKIDIHARLDPPTTPSQYSLTFSKIKYPIKLKEVTLESSPGNIFRPNHEEFIDSASLNSSRHSYTYEWEEGRLVLNVQSIGIREAYVFMKLNAASPYRFVFEDALNRIKQISIDPQLEALSIDSIWGELKTADTLFVKLKGGKPAYFIRFSREDNQYSSYEKRLNKHPRYPEVWYLEKRVLLADEEIGRGIFNIALLDSRKLEEVAYKRSTVAVKGGFFLANISLWWILLPVWIIMIVWILVKYMRNR